jgi:starch synthase
VPAHGFAPDIFSCHDWQTALIPLYLKTVFAWDGACSQYPLDSDDSQHRLPGHVPVVDSRPLGLGDDEHHLHQDDLKEGVINFLKTGIMYADAITTVSPTYAREILGEDYGMGLNNLLRERMRCAGRHPERRRLRRVESGHRSADSRRTSRRRLDGKRACKEQLMLETGLEVNPDRPLMGSSRAWSARRASSSWSQVVLPPLLERRDFAIAVLGSGERRYEDFFDQLQGRFPGRASFYRGFSNKLAHWIEAGADMFLMPSRYEPCGLNQMYSLKYGTVPVVRETGGLADSVRAVRSGAGAGHRHPVPRLQRRGAGLGVEQGAGPVRPTRRCGADHGSTACKGFLLGRARGRIRTSLFRS